MIYAIKKKLMKNPTNLNEWESFCNLKTGNPNLSKIPTLFVENRGKLKQDLKSHILPRKQHCCWLMDI